MTSQAVSNAQIEALAQAFADQFESFTRPADPARRQWKLKDTAPEWVRDIVRDLHDGHLPNDTIFRLIRETALTIIDQEGGEDPAGEADIYTGDLLTWAAEDPDAFVYLDEALVAYTPDHFGDLLRLGQGLRREELYTRLRDALIQQLTEESL